MDKIFIKGLALEAVLGVYAHEKGVKQPIKIDLEFYLSTTQSAKSQLLKDTIDYDLVAQEIAKIVADKEFELLESLAEHIADCLLQKFKMQKLECTIYKPQALYNAETVGITIIRTL